MLARSTRSLAVPAAALLAVTLVGGCGGDRPTTLKPEAVAATTAPPAAVPPAAEGAPQGAEADQEYPSNDCPATGNVKRFAKTRFALHAGLALGAFYRYIYKPLRSGGFKTGAEKRKRTFVKAAVAGLFAVHELKVAKRFALANPTLCKGVTTVTASFDRLTSKLKNGTATEADLNASKNAFTDLQQKATQNGFGFKEKNVTVPGAS
ncbi:hypothetical protein OG884_28565 [Streptosporangium sp. NBC_01755]|uniref:hypothetical protein n=1 Tax=Streptosporangium sp. NBC_01755 TaxID=2975949 RepID=UPI002DD9A93D|nr:hypothetical protein [Streptosporangium sp. NBC_01755]WSC98785.1 hypothetical protein OG884_28565 [Streptosporangium sp. NBC_01755]